LDLAPVFGSGWKSSNSPYHFPNDSHFTEAGHSIAADAIASFLEGNGYLNPVERNTPSYRVQAYRSDK
jgi:hypothetical protein